jgi:hypothetical protein
VIARETKQRAGILCAWCLGFVPEPSEPGPDSHGMCPTCSARFEAEALHAKPLGGRDN